MVCLAILAACALFAGAAAQTTVDCAMGVKDGATFAQGIYWYKCTGGQLVIQGCVTTPDNQQINPGQTFVNDKGIETTCVKNGDQISFKQTACMFNGQRITPGQTGADATTFYKCDPAGDTYLLWHKVGCVYQGQQVPFSSTITAADGVTLLMCVQTATTTAQMVATGCKGKDGKNHDVGDQYQDATQLYNCDLNGDTAVNRVVGCVSQGQAYFDYQTFSVGDQLFRCVVNPEQAQAQPVVCGCVQALPQKPVMLKNLGCSWEELDPTNSDQGYITQCELSPSGSAYTVREQCLVKIDGTLRTLMPGCYRQVGTNKNVACVQGTATSKDVSVKTFPTGDPALSSLSNTC